MDALQARSSSMNHSTGEVEKLPASQTSRRIEGYEIDRQCYGAFLLRHIDPENNRIHIESCRKDFPQFLELYQSYELRQAV